MFDPKVLITLAKRHRGAFEQLAMAEQLLNQRFTKAEEAISALVLSVASGEPLLLVGPPGTGKSRLIRSFCGLTGLFKESDQGPAYFEYLLTPFTEPSELFGYYDIPQAMKGNMTRLEEGMMQNARVVYLDEVFNGSSAILNSILTFMNERIFHDRGARRPVALECLFAATNHVPETTELAALYDRFVLRCPVANIRTKVSEVADLLEKGWVETYADVPADEQLDGLWDALNAFRDEVRLATTQGYLKPSKNHPFYKRLTQMVQHVRQYDLSHMSNRRLVKLAYLMLVDRIYQAVKEDRLGEELELSDVQLQLIPRFLLDRYDEETVMKLERAAVT